VRGEVEHVTIFAFLVTQNPRDACQSSALTLLKNAPLVISIDVSQVLASMITGALRGRKDIKKTHALKHLRMSNT